MRRTNLARSGIAVFLLVVFATEAFALSIGATPASLSFTQVRRQGYAESVIYVTTGETSPVSGHIELAREFESWITLANGTSEFVLPPQQTIPLTVTIQPPADAPSGNYTTYIDVITDGVGNITGRAGGFALSSVRILVRIEIVGEQIRACNAGGWLVRDAEIGSSLEVSGLIHNTGNVQIAPTGRVEIFDGSGVRKSERTIITDPVRPTTQRSFSQSLGTASLPLGEYTTRITFDDCKMSTSGRFSIVEKGSIQDVGELSSLLSTSWAYTGDNVPVRAVFNNYGPRTVTAKFTGTIQYEGNYIQELESDEIEVGPSAEHEFIVFFEPEREGRYVVSGKVLFNKKTTNEKGTVVTAIVPEDKPGNALQLLIFLTLVLAVIYLVRRIHRQHKRRRF